MRYISHYEEYPIYEPAEGGYYYAGNQLVATERLSKRKAKAELERLWSEAKAENLREFGEEEPKRDKDQYGNCIYPWRRIGNLIYKDSHYIGDGESYMVERHKGSATSGYHPYC